MNYKKKKVLKDTVTISCSGGKGWTVRTVEEFENNDNVETKIRKTFGFKFRCNHIDGVVNVKSRTEFDRVKQMLKEQNGNNDPQTCRKQVKLTWERPNRYYLCFTYAKKKKSAILTENKKIIALDPGVRTFQTGYDTEGIFHEFGRGDVSRIFRLGRRLDKLISKLYKTKGRNKRQNRRRMRKAIDRARFKIQNLTTDCHWKLANHLIDNYDAVLIPKFEVSQMVQKGKRKINSKTVRNMLGWSHFGFRQRLLLKAEEKQQCEIHEVTEEYTSKCCGNCGRLNHKLGGSKMFKCNSCKWTLDRDMNGARNIMIKNLENCGYKTTPLSGGPGGYALTSHQRRLQKS
jgi:putative transposase